LKHYFVFLLSKLFSGDLISQSCHLPISLHVLIGFFIFIIQTSMQVNKLLLLVMAVLTLNSIAQLFVLPSISYLADLWFPLEERFLIIGLGFYINLLGYGMAGIFSTFLSFPNTYVTVDSIALTFAIVATFSFILSLFAIKNEPKTRMEKRKTVNFHENMKALYDRPYQGYLIIIVGIFLSVDWAFLTQCINFRYLVGGMEK
jgi:sugar phosphate permease